jgi:epoxyqueuosine reductase QueG
VKCGLALPARNSLLLTKDFGSLFVIGILTTPFEIEGTASKAQTTPFPLCVNCDEENPPCKKACPTGAVTGGGNIIKEKCMQWYLSGHEKEIPQFIKDNLHGKLYGCTHCTDACIYNKKPIMGESCDIGVLSAVLDAKEIAAASDAELKAMFHKTALGMSWLCPTGIRRNAKNLWNS